MAKAKGTTSARRPRIGNERLIVLALSLWLAGCNNQQPAAHGPPPAEVTVSKPEQKEVVNWNEFTGRTAAVKLVTVTARVSGYIVDIPFKEGDIVHKGDLLFQIDPRPYQHAYDQAVGQLHQAQANQILQAATFARQQHLRETKVIANEDYDTALSNKDQAAAQVIATQAPIYAYFSMDELAALSYQRLILEGKVASSQDGKVPVYLQLQDETGFPHEGTIDFSDNAFDSTTGTLLVRGTFPNSDGFLTPGNFVRVRVASSPKYDALLVADRAIGSDQDQSFVYVVDSKNIARLRHIKTGQLAEGLRVVKSGLQREDEVIINGIIKVRPDSPVKPQLGAMEQFSSNDLSMPLLGSKSKTARVDGERKGNSTP